MLPQNLPRLDVHRNESAAVIGIGGMRECRQRLFPSVGANRVAAAAFDLVDWRERAALAHGGSRNVERVRLRRVRHGPPVLDATKARAELNGLARRLLFQEARTVHHFAGEPAQLDLRLIAEVVSRSKLPRLAIQLP